MSRPRQIEMFQSRWRQRFFADGAEAAMRYDIRFEHVAAHLAVALQRRPHLPACAVGHFDDLVHVAACRAGVSQAWTDLHDRFERTLVRCCRTHLPDENPVVHVRRTLRDMRSGVTDGRPLPRLADYAGATPLRDWLTSRFLDGLVGGDELRTAAMCPPADGRLSSPRASRGAARSV